MKLSYRGVSYESIPARNATVDAPAPILDLKYRGAAYRQQATAKAQAPALVLKYRGIAHATQPQAAAAAPQSVATHPSVQEQARLVPVTHHRLIKNRQQSLLSRWSSEVGLASNVSGYWNHIQGKIHPTFRLNYDRAHVTMS